MRDRRWGQVLVLDRRIGARGRRVRHCRERMQIMRFCVRGAGRPMAFTAASGSRAA
jgi:hypothetical protein